MTTSDVTVTDITPGDGTEWVSWVSLTPWGFSKYEAYSSGGYGLDPSQWPIRHKTKRTRLKVTLGTHGYPQVKPYNDQGKQETRTVHSLILLANVGPPGDGQETRHLNNDPLDYRWAPGGTDEEVKAAGGNLVYGTKPQNHADQVKAGTASPPPAAFPCATRIGCGNPVTFADATCLPCRTEAAALVSDGTPLARVAARFGKGEQWAFAAARDFGGYRGTIAQARAGHRKPLLRRVIDRLRWGGGR